MTSEESAPPVHATVVGESGSSHDTVAFLHGLFGRGRNFTAIAKALQPRFRSLLVDLPDHGRSAWTEDFGYAQFADLVADRLREDGAAERPVDLVGHSMGGKVAMALALRHPDLVDRLVVVDISPVGGGDQGEFVHLLDSLAGLDLTTLTGRSDADERLREPIPNDTVRGFLLQNLRAGTDGYEWQPNLDLLRRELPQIGSFPDDLTGPFDRPVLWVAGERSPYVKPEHEEAMRRLFPRTSKVTIKGAGHWVHSERPEVFISVLRAFLTEGRADPVD